MRDKIKQLAKDSTLYGFGDIASKAILFSATGLYQDICAGRIRYSGGDILNMSIKSINLSKAQKDFLGKTVSFSVDCDALVHYLNFAPDGTKVEHDKYTYTVMCREILRIFKKYEVKATFFCIADQLADPQTLDIFKGIIASGHEIGNHTFCHPDIASLTEGEHLYNIRLAHEKIKTLLGVEPVGFRAPAYFITESGLHEIAKLGYLYDSSLCHSAAVRLLTLALKVFNPDFRPKKQPSLYSCFKGKAPYVVEFSDRKKLLEWPIPNIGGLAYYGTLHCCAPSAVFSMQTLMLNSFRKYIHYEIHPIEVITNECRRDFPWINKIPFTARDNLLKWLEHRIRILVSNRKAMTLRDLSDAYIHL